MLVIFEERRENAFVRKFFKNHVTTQVFSVKICDNVIFPGDKSEVDFFVPEILVFPKKFVVFNFSEGNLDFCGSLVTFQDVSEGMADPGNDGF